MEGRKRKREETQSDTDGKKTAGDEGKSTEPAKERLAMFQLQLAIILLTIFSLLAVPPLHVEK